MNKSLALTVGLALVVVGAAAWFFLVGGGPVQVGPDPRPGSKVVILLHGYGAAGDDLVPLARELSQAAPEVTFLLPAGAHRAGVRGRSWHENLRADSQDALEKKMLADRRAAVLQIVAIARDLAADGIEPADMTVGGFSQGANVSLDVVLSEEGSTIGGLWFLSGGRHKFDLDRLGRREPLRALVSHGTKDPVLNDRVSKALVQALEQAGRNVEFIQFEGGHAIPNKTRQALKDWLRSS